VGVFLFDFIEFLFPDILLLIYYFNETLVQNALASLFADRQTQHDSDGYRHFSKKGF
jgi:hypothetical protein